MKSNVNKIKYSNANLKVVFALLCTSLPCYAIYLVSWPQHLLQFFFWHFENLKLEKLESIGAIYSTSDWFFMEHDLTSYRKRILMFGKLMSPSKGQIISEEMVFCYQNCSDLLWERILLVIEKNFWNSRLKAVNLQKIWDH